MCVRAVPLYALVAPTLAYASPNQSSKVAIQAVLAPEG